MCLSISHSILHPRYFGISHYHRALRLGSRAMLESFFNVHPVKEPVNWKFPSVQN